MWGRELKGEDDGFTCCASALVTASLTSCLICYDVQACAVMLLLQARPSVSSVEAPRAVSAVPACTSATASGWKMHVLRWLQAPGYAPTAGKMNTQIM